MPEAPPPGSPPPPGQVVGQAIQNLAASRLGRGFIPLALLLLVGLGLILTEGGGVGFMLALGAPLSAAAMLAFGQRVVQSAFGRPRRPWMAWAAVAGLLPPAYGIWVMAWLGLRGLAAATGPTDMVVAGVDAVLGFWSLRSWLRIVELQRLAEAMTLDFSVNREEEQR